jgi:hypothetical protein
MSLDVYLTIPKTPTKCVCTHCWNEHDGPNTEEVYSSNITHNLGAMASEAGIYEACWHPDKIGITKAGQIIPILEKGIADMEARRNHYEQFNAKNGWGLYKHFMPWLRDYLDACRNNPEADVRTST